MKKQLVRIALLGLVAAALAAVPATVSAQETNGMTAPAPKNTRAPFKGKVTAVDTAAMTLTIGDSEKIYVTSKTKITKDGKPATLSDVTVGEAATGAYKEEDGKKNATTIHVGEKAPKKEKKPTDGADAAPAAPKN